MAIVAGSIIYVRIGIPDPQGRNPKPNRPFVVLRPPTDGRVQALGITHQLNESPAEHYQTLQYGPNCRTGMKTESAVLCNWLIDVSVDDCDSRGFVDPRTMVRIGEKLNALNPNLYIVP